MAKYDFTVTIDGVDLPAETLGRINSALQKALLSELAAADTGVGEIAYRPIMSELIRRDAHAAAARIGGGSTGGIAVRALKA